MMDDIRKRFSKFWGKTNTLMMVKPTPPFDFLMQIPEKFQNCLKQHLEQSQKHQNIQDSETSMFLKNHGFDSVMDASLEKQLQAWKENPTWVDHPPEIKVSVPKGSLCNLNVKFEVGLPPDAVYNIVTDPENKRVFKNIKEVISRRVMVNEGQRQVVEVEQAALWRFLWWSGVMLVHVFVDQNRKDHTVKFKQGKAGFMKRFEGAWKIDSNFVDKDHSFPFEPKTITDYELCSNGKGRIGSVVHLQQLVEPALLPPPPISWYLRGITTRTVEMLITDLRSEAARIRGVEHVDFVAEFHKSHLDCVDSTKSYPGEKLKERWHERRKMRRHKRKRLPPL
ncbi:uncharacterized protein LOC18430529 isoform X1 [Amborella trichopoda]|uniref:uncharacterized protein LOC18430529 isoform X1 n=1 Tax=Amborella trichopoda TaxID=13333 RepID=UPI0005D3A19C|nr:uncharacterized protein LOC18430529 isoform X1 [Amborella trichopoda]|eukprot:XP_011622022.1 uncharacterized protein LOC18430529 isoform X1 [Amborella trichopoda]